MSHKLATKRQLVSFASCCSKIQPRESCKSRFREGYSTCLVLNITSPGRSVAVFSYSSVTCIDVYGS